MAIRLTNLQRIADQYDNKSYAFQDLHLDFAKSSVFSKALNKNIDGNDIKVSYDEAAISNSIKNLFNTRPGQRFLFPLYGLNLVGFLFEAVNDMNGRMIGERIVAAINQYEPRVVVQLCQVIPKPDDHEYEINLVVNIPAFDANLPLNMFLDVRTKSFSFGKTLLNN